MIMQVYQEITLLHNPEIPCHFLWEKLFQQIHLALVKNKIISPNLKNDSGKPLEYSEYGISFPQYDAQLNALGCKLRVFAETDERLKCLNLLHWLERLHDYCRCTPIEPIPQGVRYARFKRKQFTNNPKRLARRRITRLTKQGKHETLEQALAYYSGHDEKKTRLPFIYLDSKTWKTRLPLFIERELVSEPVQGSFSCYGLSKTATVPWF